LLISSPTRLDAPGAISALLSYVATSQREDPWYLSLLGVLC